MKHILVTQALPLVHDDITVSVKGRVVTVRGKNVETGEEGELVEDFSHTNTKIKLVNTKTKGKKMVVSLMNQTTKTAAVVRTVCTTVKKMIQGVRTGYRYKMRLVYAHFPINVKIVNDNKTIEIRNFLGEKVVRRVNMMGDTIVKEGDLRDELYIEGINLK
eukprot:UN26547